MSMSVSSGFAVIPNFEGIPSLLTSNSFTSRQAEASSPSALFHGSSTPLSLANRSLMTSSLGCINSTFEEEDEELLQGASPTFQRSASLVGGWYRGSSAAAEDTNLSPRRFSLFHPTAAAPNQYPQQQQRGSNQRVAQPPQSPPTTASNKTAHTSPGLNSSATSPPLQTPTQSLPQTPALPPQTSSPPSLSCPTIPSESMRSVTPPPTIIDKQVDVGDEEGEGDDGWVSISTVNMSPFMVLRIKALIELASVEPTIGGSDPDVLLKVMNDDSVKLKPCLKPTMNVCDETSRLERARSSMDPDERYVTLLNDLLESARQKASPPSIAQINETYNSHYKVLKRSASASNSRTKLSFSEGASLLCFDSSEKPRRVKDNHKRHFAKFLSYQRSSSAGSSGGATTSSLLGVPKSASMSSPAPFAAAASSMTATNLSPQLPSPSSTSTQTPSPATSGMSSGSSTPPVTPTLCSTNGAGGPSSCGVAGNGIASAPPPAGASSAQPMPPLRSVTSNAHPVPRHVSPRLTEAFVSSIASNTSASAAVLASVLQGDASNLRVYGQTVKAPPKPLTSLLQRQDLRRFSTSANGPTYGGAHRTA